MDTGREISRDMQMNKDDSFAEMYYGDDLDEMKETLEDNEEKF